MSEDGIGERSRREWRREEEGLTPRTRALDVIFASLRQVAAFDVRARRKLDREQYGVLLCALVEASESGRVCARSTPSRVVHQLGSTVPNPAARFLPYAQRCHT